MFFEEQLVVPEYLIEDKNRSDTNIFPEDNCGVSLRYMNEFVYECCSYFDLHMPIALYFINLLHAVMELCLIIEVLDSKFLQVCKQDHVR